ncbi:MAG: hypothetical protein NZO16_07485, partial [Deltaproteobacteria bacterium]|nr:hypothetical protein [Deltaproteobacteria bacterium]
EDIYSNVHLKSSKTGHFGRYRQIDVKNTCLRFLNNLFYEQNLNKLKIVIDCAHGSNFSFAPVVFEHLGAEVIAIGANPDGRNINETGCMNPNKCVEVCGEVKADFGLCFDGDGDRCLVCTSNQIFDGDWTLAVLTKFRQYVFTKNLNGVVGTVISNSALGALCQAEGVGFTRAPVGDVNVLSEMLKNGFNLGGEPAGHTILLEKAKFGDGLVTGLALAIVLNSIKQENGDLQCIRGFYSPYPQKHFNFPVEFRKPLSEFDDLNRAIIDAEKEGMRIVVRYSGTENALRLTIEGRYDEEIEMHYSRIKRILIENKLIKS